MSSDELVQMFRSISDSFYTEPLWAKIQPLIGLMGLGVSVYVYIRMSQLEKQFIERLKFKNKRIKEFYENL